MHSLARRLVPQFTFQTAPPQQAAAFPARAFPVRARAYTLFTLEALLEAMRVAATLEARRVAAATVMLLVFLPELLS